MKTKQIKSKVERFPLLGYRPDIDGLRAIAVLSVVGFHAFPKAVPGGFAGVDIFFVISGFLISNQILHRLERGDFTLPDFYFRRIRRIFPALVVVLLACFALGWFALFANEFAQLAKQIAAGATFLSNFVLWQESGYFDTSSKLKPLLHLWSLGVEEQFYLLWPVTLLLAFRARLKILPLVIGVLIASLGFNLYYVGVDASGAFYLPFSRFWELMAGGVLTCISLKRYGTMLSVAGVALIVASFAILRESLAYPGVWALLPTIGAFLVLSAGPDSWINRHILANRLFVGIGLISYPLYLWHWPLLSFGDIVQSGTLSTVARFAAIGLSFGLATLTYFAVERPIRFGSKTPAVAYTVAGFLAIAGIAGWIVFRDNGVESRQANVSGNFARDIAVPASTYTSDGSCRPQGLEQIKNEVCISAAKPDVLVAGDSHAIALNSAPFLGAFPAKTLLISANSCLPFVDYVSHGPYETKQDKICVDVAWQTLGAARSHPEIRNVVLSTRGPIYFSGRAFGVEADDASRDGWQIESAEAHDDATTNLDRFHRGFSKFIGMLEGYGKSVTMMIDVPELGIDPRTCIPARPLTFSPPQVSPCTVPRSTVDERQRDYRNAVKALSAEHPKMRVFDPLPIFCDQQFCYGKKDEHLWYYDTNHMTVYASERIWNALMPLLR